MSVTDEVLFDVVAALERRVFSYTDEAMLQDGIGQVLREDGFDVRAEVRLNARDRIDFMVGRVGIEVKVAGQLESVLRQLTRYSKSEQVDALVLVTSRARHTNVESKLWLSGKPVKVVSLLGAL